MRPPKFGFSFGITCLCVFSGPLWAAAPPSRGATLPALIRDLGADCYQTREEATRLLLLRCDAVPALRTALKSEDLEVRRRASRILHRFAERYLQRAAVLMKAGRCDQAIDLMLLWGAGSSTGLAETSQFARLLLQEVKSTAKIDILQEPIILANFFDFEKLPKRRRQPQWLFSHGPLLVDGKKTPFSGIARAPSLEILGDVESSLALASESIDGIPDRHRSISTLSILVTSGSVNLDKSSSSVIIAGGAVRVGQVYNSLIIAGGPITCSQRATDSVFVSRCTASMSRSRTSSNLTIIEHDPHPLGLIRFFESHQTGIAVTSGKGRVVVSALASDKAFATAGIRVGDTIAALGDAKVENPESFRRLLRVHAAELSPFTLTLDRDGKKLSVRVTLTE